MKKASISQIKNHLSEYLDQVTGNGEAIVITKRDRPIAQLVPMNGTRASSNQEDEARLQRLERAGLIRRGSGKPLPLDWFKKAPKLKRGVSLLRALLEEREEGR